MVATDATAVLTAMCLRGTHSTHSEDVALVETRKNTFLVIDRRITYLPFLRSTRALSTETLISRRFAERLKTAFLARIIDAFYIA